MKYERLSIPEVVLFTPARIGDERGFFSETWTARAMADIGVDLPFVQDNHSMSQARGVLRGLHCQLDPHTQVVTLQHDQCRFAETIASQGAAVSR